MCFCFRNSLNIPAGLALAPSQPEDNKLVNGGSCLTKQLQHQIQFYDHNKTLLPGPVGGGGKPTLRKRPFGRNRQSWDPPVARKKQLGPPETWQDAPLPIRTSEGPRARHLASLLPGSAHSVRNRPSTSLSPRGRGTPALTFLRAETNSPRHFGLFSSLKNS